jgi:hypothetical protein
MYENLWSGRWTHDARMRGGEGVMVPEQYRVGDRVQARGSGFVPKGTPGTVQQVLGSFPSMYYYVQFDGYDQPKLMHARDLERADGPGQAHDDAGGDPAGVAGFERIAVLVGSNSSSW